ncbi:MAG: PAS domain-containing hybrid sensor histidine kinase/response regulator [Pseudomonadota bacterium]
MQGWGTIIVAISYLLFLFVVASYGDRRRATGQNLRQRPTIYALSLAIYCTSWTFFGSVGLATTSGLDFLAIYVGPVLMITLGAPLLSHIISIAKSERITSIADFIASRYGKSTTVGALAASIAVLGIVPYIALQLKAISTSVEIMVTQYQPSVLSVDGPPVDTSIFVSILLAVFAVLFGTRHADATEHQDGLMLAVATESIIKLLAFLAVGVFVTYYIFDGFGDLVQQAQTSAFVSEEFYGGINPLNFLVLTLLSGFAFLLLPRQFHVGVVENHSKADLKTARWMFPLYLVLINLFVVPVAIAGMLKFGRSVDADTYVLALPISAGADFISLTVFIGGLSAATAMVIVACVALAIMISNNMILPLMLRRDGGRRLRDMAPVLLNIRRTAIFIILALAYIYYQAAGDSAALAAIGLLSFAAVAQFAPAFIGGMLWRRATARGAVWGMIAGFGMWLYTLFIPTLLDANAPLLVEGAFGIEWLRPQALFGTTAAPLDHGVFFSLLANTLAFIIASLTRKPKAIERLQANTFWIRGQSGTSPMAQSGAVVTVAELRATISNYLGYERCERAFEGYFNTRNLPYDTREIATGDLIHFSEQLLASAIGAASSRLVISLLLKKHEPAAETTIQLLDDASEAIQYNRDLLQTALDQVEQGISVFDRDFKLSSWNRQFRQLLALPTHMGQAGLPLSALSDELSRHIEHYDPKTDDLVKKLLDTREPFIVSLAETGRIVEVETKSVPDGGLVISWNDITEREEASRALQEANETLERRVRERTEELTRLNEDLALAREAAETANVGKTRFLAAVGHDILQPLNAARLYASSLAEHLNDDQNQRLALNVDESLESVEDILGSVLAISRLDAGVLTPNVTEFEVDRLFRRLDIEFRPSADAKGLAFEVVSNDFHIRSDYSLLRRLLQNLVSNAIKYTESGSIRLDARVVRNRILIEVKDTGSGIHRDDHVHVFEEFKRLDAGKKAASGLGLGLSIVKRLSDTLGHELTFESKPGKGSAFCVAVPLVVAKAEVSNEIKIEPSKDLDFSNLIVFCIDNEPRILDGMKTLLQGWGCTVHTYEHSSQLLQDLAKHRPHILIADYHLDNENGLDVIESARALNRQNDAADITAALVTADRSASVRLSAKAAEVALMNKPLKPAALRAMFAQLLKSAQSNSEKMSTSQTAGHEAAE